MSKIYISASTATSLPVLAKSGMKSKSLWHLALKEEVSDIIESEIGATVLSDNQYGDDDGNIYYPLSSFDLWNQSPQFDGPSNYRNSISSLIDMLNPVVKTIGFDQDQGFDLEAFLSNLCTLPDVYGCLLKDRDNSDYMINPLHPLTALAIKLGQVKLPKRGKLIIYNWKDRILNNYNINEDNNYKSSIEQVWLQFIGQSSNFIGKKVSERRLNVSKKDYLDQLGHYDALKQVQLFGNIEYKEVSEVADIKMILVPLQVAVSNIATPFYGVSYVKDPASSPKGKNAGVMISGNIKYSEGSTDGTVCTGSRSSTRDTGWLTLNRVNLDSMFYSEIICSDNRNLIDHVYTSKYIASQFYKVEATEEGVE